MQMEKQVSRNGAKNAKKNLKSLFFRVSARKLLSLPPAAGTIERRGHARLQSYRRERFKGMLSGLCEVR